MDQLNHADIAELSELCSGGVATNVDLSTISWWRIGGRADLVLRPSSTDEVAALMRWFTLRGQRPIVIGLTTNLLFDDAGLRAPCIQIGHRMAHAVCEGQSVYAQAGVWVPKLARKIMQAGITGVEHTCGIPGTLGGLVCMNGGSQRKNIGSNIVTIESVDSDGQIHLRCAEDCSFSYRSSIYQVNNEIITSAKLQLSLGDKKKIRQSMLNIMAERNRKFPRKQPNCGSVFKSNPVMYADIGPPGLAIEKLGFKGFSVGDALVSQEHANFFLNTGQASAIDMLKLISVVRNTVYETTGYKMETEVRFVNSQGEMVAAV